MYGRLYTCVAAQTAVTAARDLLFIKATDAVAFAIHEIHVTQVTEAGDAQSEQLTIAVSRFTGTVTDGSGGAAITPRPLGSGAAAAVVTVRGFDSTATSGGTEVTLARRAYNVMAGWEFVFPLHPLVFSAGNGATAESIAVVKLITAPADSVTFEVEALIEEIG